MFRPERLLPHRHVGRFADLEEEVARDAFEEAGQPRRRM